MTKYTLAIKDTEGLPTARSTQDMDEALDWFTNAATEVMDEEGDLEVAMLTVEGVLWGVIQRGGWSGGPEGGEVIHLETKAA